MRSSWTMLHAALAAAGAVASLCALADENCSGYRIDVGGKRVVVNNDPSAPGFPQVGSCRETGTAFGTRSYRDADGDEYTSEWRATPGTPGSAGRWTWKVTGGSGKHADAKSAGWSRRIFSEDHVTVEMWVGGCRWSASRRRRASGCPAASDSRIARHRP